VIIKCTKFGQLILKKIINIVATRCQILRLKCTKSFVGTTIEQLRHLAMCSLFEDLRFQNRTVHSSSHSPMTRTIDPSSLMAQSMLCVCVCVRACVHEIPTLSSGSLTRCNCSLLVAHYSAAVNSLSVALPIRTCTIDHL